MPILRNVLGLDLGSHALKAVEVQQTLRGVEAVQMQSIPRGDPDASLAEPLARLLQVHKLSTEHVVSALPGDLTSSRRLSFPFRDRRRLSSAVPFELESDLPFDLDEFVVDWALVGGERARAEVLATLARRSDVSDLIESLRGAGCEPRTLEVEGFVLANLGAVFDLPDTRLLADLGHRKSTFCLLIDGKPAATRTVPIGGLMLTEALAKDRSLDPERAERVKCEEGIASPSLGVAPAAAGVVDQIGREILRTLASLEPLLGTRSVAEVTLLGGTAQLDRIDEWICERTGVETARLGLPSEGQGKGFVAGGSPVVFAPAIALALRGTAQARTRMNFRQDEFAFRLDLSRYRRDFGATAVLAGIALVLAIASFFTVTAMKSRAAGALEQEVQRLYTEAFPDRPVPANPISALRQEVEAANERAEFLGVYPGNLSALDVLTEISRHVPADLEVVFEDLTIDRQTIRIRVFAQSFESADRLSAALAQFPPFAQARVGAAERDPKTGGLRFNVTIVPASEKG